MATENKKLKNFLTPVRVIWGLVAFVFVIMLFTSFFIVNPDEQCVITRFGRYYETLGPGLHYKLPFGIDKKYVVPGPKAIQTEQFGFVTTHGGPVNQYKNGITNESTMLTGDLNIVDVEWIIQYRITDPKAWLFTVQEKEQTIRDISRSVVNTLVGDRAILEVMSNERTNIENLAVEQMNLQYKKLGIGIDVSAVKLQNIVPPAGVQDAFEDVNKAIQDMNPRAKGEADQKVQVAEGYAAERVNKAKGDVARFNSVYEEYRKAPAVTRDRLYLETMEEIFAGQDKEKKPALIDSELENILPVKNLGKN